MSARCALPFALVVVPVAADSPARADVGGVAATVLQKRWETDPVWGCGLVGTLPNITQDGRTSLAMQRFIDAVKGSSTLNKVTFWNWGLAPQKEEHLSADFLFIPENWGSGPVEARYLRSPGPDFVDSNGKLTHATMAPLLLGMNEPDITGSCMGNLFGKCSRGCSAASVQNGDCPTGYLSGTGEANALGECNCWEYSYASGVGFWDVPGCDSQQPLPKLWEDERCVDVVMGHWRQTARIAVDKGYRYLSTPLLAVDISYARRFIERACATCQDASCGCPVYVGFHFYAFDCQPEATGAYAGFKQRLDAVAEIMEAHPYVKGAIINEVGMLNCAFDPEKPICVPDAGKFPASSSPDMACPSNGELPNGLATFMDKLFDLMLEAKTRDGRSVVKGFSWFNEDRAGGTYNLQLFRPDGSINSLGEAFMRNCARWGETWRRG